MRDSFQPLLIPNLKFDKQTLVIFSLTNIILLTKMTMHPITHNIMFKVNFYNNWQVSRINKELDKDSCLRTCESCLKAIHGDLREIVLYWNGQLGWTPALGLYL